MKGASFSVPKTRDGLISDPDQIVAIANDKFLFAG